METDIRLKSLAGKYRALEAGTERLVAGKKDRSNTRSDKLCPQARHPPKGVNAERVEQLSSLERTYRDVVIHQTVHGELSKQILSTAESKGRAAKSSPIERKVLKVGPPLRASAVRCTKTGLRNLAGDVKHRRTRQGHRDNSNAQPILEQSSKSKPPPPPPRRPTKAGPSARQVATRSAPGIRRPEL